MAKPYVITNRRRLDQFFRDGNKIDNVGMIVGQVTGKPKYPVGHVGRRSRGPKNKNPTRKIRRQELERRAWVRVATKQLQQLSGDEQKKTRKEWIKWFKAEEKRRGHGRGSFRARGINRRRRQAVAVARVAGVLASDRVTGQYHERAILAHRAHFKLDMEKVRNTLFSEADPVTAIKEYGKSVKKTIRQYYLATGHSDTGRVFRNIQYLVFSRSGKAEVEAFNKKAKADAARARAARKKRESQ